MKKQFVAASLLMLFSTTATFAQRGSTMGNIVGESLEAGERNGAPPNIPRHIIYDRSFKLPINQPIVAGSAMFGGQAALTLKTNALVMERTTMEMAGDAYHTTTTPVWSIPFSGAAKEMEFQSDGNLVVRDSGNQVLWASNRSAPGGQRLMVDFNGKLQVYNENGGVLWEK